LDGHGWTIRYGQRYNDIDIKTKKSVLLISKEKREKEKENKNYREKPNLFGLGMSV
jgi:hypothetical protein